MKRPGKIIGWALLAALITFTACNPAENQSTTQEPAETATTENTDGEAAVGRDNSEVRPSPNASVSQNVGKTVVTIVYGRPGVKGRTVFGELEPFGEVWRAGANEATVFSFSDDVTVGGQELAAGSYAFFLIPQESGEWTAIFNKIAEQWGAYDYDESEDALRISVAPETVEKTEWLAYSFANLTDSSADVNMDWDTSRIRFTIAAK